MSQSTYNLRMKDAETLITSFLKEESERTGFQFQINRKGDFEVQTKIETIPIFSFPSYDFPSIYERLVWEVVKSEANCTGRFNPRTLMFGEFEAVVRCNNSTHYATELFQATPEFIGIAKRPTTCTLSTKAVTCGTLLTFHNWVHLLASAPLLFDDSCVLYPEVDKIYVGTRGKEQFIVQCIDKGFRLTKENGKQTTAAKMYDIELHELQGDAARLPYRILCSRIYKGSEVGTNGGVSGSGVAERKDIT